jgi:Major Facilitator Superfamily
MSSDLTTTALPSTRADELDLRCWLALGVILVAALMNLLDAGIAFLTLPSIQQDLHASYAALQWMAAGYTLAFTLVLITAGRLSDIFGRKRLFLVSMAGPSVAGGPAADHGVDVWIVPFQRGGRELTPPIAERACAGSSRDSVRGDPGLAPRAP